MINHPINKLMILCKDESITENRVLFNVANRQKIPSVIEKMFHDEKIEKLKKLQKHQDSDFCELGVDDGLVKG
jgi:hypothetical protein